MKRSRMPDRTKPLTSSTSLERKSRLRSSGPALRPVRARKTPQGAEEKEAKRLTRARSGGWCEMRVPGFCLGRATEFSHRWAQGQGGLWLASNGLDSCGLAGCHGWLHRNPNEAKRLGWIIPPTYRIEAGARVPIPTSEFHAYIWLRDDVGPRWVQLTNDGQYQDIAQEAS